MKKTYKRLTSMMLAMLLAFSLNCTVFAANYTAATTEAMAVRAAATEIQTEKNRVYEAIREQLEVQGASGHFEIYKAMVDAQIEADVYEKYGLSPASTTRATSVTYSGFNYGGSIGYEGPIGDAVCLTTALDYDNSYYYVLGGTSNSFKLKNILVEIGATLASSALPTGWGAAFSALCALSTVVNQSGKNSIIEQDGFAMILNVDSTTEGSSSVLLGWSGHAARTLTIPSAASNVKVCYFPEHDPFA